MLRKFRRKRFLIPLTICGLNFLVFCALQYFMGQTENHERAEAAAAEAAQLANNMESERVSDVITLNEFIALAAPTTNFEQRHQHRSQHDFNRQLSDKIGAYRALPDTRDEACRARNYYLQQRQRLKVSVIIAFHNEARSTLMRTIMSVYRRTAAKYLHELILVDDNSEDVLLLSTLRHLTVPPFARSTFNFDNATARQRNVAGNANEGALDDKQQQRHQKNTSDFVVIKMQRNSRRLGLIESRNHGARLATGDYLFFLDSHCEVNVGWLEPLLERAVHASSASIAVSPVLDSIDAKTLQYQASSQQLMGGFDWNLHFHWVRKNRQSGLPSPPLSDTFRSPVTAGGVFLVSRSAFHKLNGFNSMLKIWGGESIEFSIKMWLCGGRVEIAPCSRVGHVFRKQHFFRFPTDDDGQETYLSNSKIIAEHWLDGYKHFFYALKPAAKNLKLNISKAELQIFKQTKKCKPFAWYLSNVFPELKLPNDDFIAFGTLSTAERCLHISQEPYQVLLNQKSAISSSSKLFERPTTMYKPHVRLQMANCYHTDVTQWYLHRHNGHLHSSSGACLNVIRVPMAQSLPLTRSAAASYAYTFLNQTLYLDAVAASHFIVVLQYCHQLTTTTTTTTTTTATTSTAKSQRWLRRGAQLIHEQTHLCLDNPLNDVVAVSHCRHEAPSQLFHFTREMQQLWQL